MGNVSPHRLGSLSQLTPGGPPPRAPEPVVPRRAEPAAPRRAPVDAFAPTPLLPDARISQQLQHVMDVAERRSGGQKPGGWCYREVWGILTEAGYGRIPAARIPGSHTSYAYQFAEYADLHLAELGLRRLELDNPYDAPAGAIVVVRAGAPGTRHPVAGDIAIAMGQGRFLNDGEMGYDGPWAFTPGNDFVKGIYVPA